MSKRKSVTPEQELAAEIYRKKLRSYSRGLSAPLKLIVEKEYKKSPNDILSVEVSKKFSFKNSYPQRFSLPESIIYYIARHPRNVHCHQNLMKSCKELVRMSPIIPVEEVLHCYQQPDDNTWLANDTTNINLQDQSCKLWIYDKLEIYNNEENFHFASKLLQNVCMFSLREVKLRKQALTIRELEILLSGGKLEKIYFDGNTIKDEDGSIADFGKVFEAIVCREMEISIYPGDGFSATSAIKIKEVLSSKKESHKIILEGIPEEIDMDEFRRLIQVKKKGNIMHTIEYRKCGRRHVMVAWSTIRFCC